MSKWKTVRLGDVCEIAAGQGAPQGDSNYCDEGTPFVKAGNLIELIEGKSEKQIQKVSEEVAKSNKLKKYKASSILFAKSGMSCMKGYVYQLKNDCYVVSHLAIVKPKEDFSDYIEYCLRHIKPNTLVKDEAYPSISLQDISNLQIPLPPLETQKQIAAVLDKCTSLISKYKKILEKYDTLIKSRFIEMFGDPITNPKHWNTKAITELCENIMGGGTPSKSKPEYFEGTIPWVSPKDMKSLFIFDSQDHITETAVNNSSAKKIKSDSILMVIRSGILKHTLPVAMNKVEVTINQDMKAFTPSSEINPYYLLFYFKGIERDVLSGVRAVTADNIDFNQFKKRHVILPPKQMQEDFATFVQQIDKSKFAVQKSLEKAETLYKSLMQEYFG